MKSENHDHKRVEAMVKIEKVLHKLSRSSLQIKASPEKIQSWEVAVQILNQSDMRIGVSLQLFYMQ